jgi:hypothetical protein
MSLARYAAKLARVAESLRESNCSRTVQESMTLPRTQEAIITAMGIVLAGITALAVAHADEINRFEVALRSSETQRLCDEFFLPNSMAHLPGFDVHHHMHEIEVGLRRRAELFRSPAGLAYLRTQQGSASDDIGRACAEKLLEYAGATPANTASQPTPKGGVAERGR